MPWWAHTPWTRPAALLFIGFPMARVTGVGGVFFKARDPESLTNWYQQHLGLPVDDEGVVVLWWGDDVKGSTVWAPLRVGHDCLRLARRSSMDYQLPSG